MAVLKNITNGPKGVNAPGGLVLIEAGQTVEVELDDAELASSLATGWFEEAKAKPEPKAEPAKGEGRK